MGELTEAKLRILHDFLYEAMGFPELVTDYTTFVRVLRERLHPVGVKDIKQTELDGGIKFVVNVGDRLGCDIYYGFYQEYFDCQLLWKTLDKGEIFLDIGANFGYYAINAANLWGKNSKIYAFEPNPEAYQLLTQNLELNNFTDIVKAEQICLGDKDGETDFYIFSESSFSGMSSTGRSTLEKKVRIPMFSLDSFLDKKGISSIDGMKIDVEGFEYAVLEGAKETLKRSPNPIIMMEVSAKNLNQERRDRLITTLREMFTLGFRAAMIDTGSLHYLNNPEEIAQIGSTNLFLTLANSPRDSRLQQAYEQLRIDAFRGIAENMALSAEEVIKRNKRDPLGYTQLYGALLGYLLGDRDATIDKLRSEITLLKQELNQPLKEKIMNKIKQKFK